MTQNSRRDLKAALESNLRFVTLYRIFLAFLVLYSHAFPIFLGTGDPQFPIFLKTSVSFGTLAVGGFFSLSGLLLYNSATLLKPRDWVRRRAFRLFPAYIFCLLSCSLIIGPIAQLIQTGTLHNYFNSSPVGPFAYFWNNLFMPIGITYALNDSFISSPYGLLVGASAMNGSLWSLPYEIRCYFVLAVIGYIFNSKMRDRIIPILTVFTFIGFIYRDNQIFQKFSGPLWIFSDGLFLQLLTIFLLGACFGVYAKKIALSYTLLLSLMLVYILSTYNYNLLATIGISTIGLLPFLLATKIPKKWLDTKVFSLDISYGFYLYSFPIQQLLIIVFPDWDFSSLLILSTLAVLMCSILSYKLLELPMIKIGKRNYD
jgi:peptidoglycan/LPS O-acetylase OafA/YrhL